MAVNHPEHYNKGMYEVINVIEDWDLGFHLGNAIKYIARAKYKSKETEDIQKAIWYLNRYLKVTVVTEIKVDGKGKTDTHTM